MSGSSGNTSSGTEGGRTPRNGNSDVTARHGAHGDAARDDTGAEASARGTRTGRNDSKPADPDVESSDEP